MRGWSLALDTFELQKSRASLAEEGFYEPIVWVAIQRITLPICVFFRCTLQPGHSSEEVEESNINIASTHPPSQVPRISGADRLLERLLQKRGGGGCP